MNSSKMSLKEGFDFLFENEQGNSPEEKTEKKPKTKRRTLTLDGRFNEINSAADITSAQAAVAGFVLCDIVFSALDDKEPLLFQKYKALKDQSTEGGGGKTIKLFELIKNLKLRTDYKELYKRYQDKVSINGQEKIKILSKLYTFSTVALWRQGKKEIVLENKNPKIGLKFESYRNILLRTSQFINSDKIEVTKIADVIEKTVQSNELISSGFDDVSFDDSNVENKDVANKFAEYFNGYLKDYMNPENFDPRSTKAYNKKTTDKAKEKYLYDRKRNFWTNTFGSKEKYQKILTAISNREFDLAKFVLRGLVYRKHSSNIADQQIVGLYKILFGKEISSDNLERIFKIASEYSKKMSKKGADTSKEAIEYTSAHSQIQSILNNNGLNTLGNPIESQTQDEAEQEEVSIEIPTPVAAAAAEEAAAETGDKLDDPEGDVEEDDGTDYVFFDGVLSNDKHPHAPVVNGYMLLSLRMKYDANYNPPDLTDYDSFKKLSKEAFLYLCDNEHLVNESKEKISGTGNWSRVGRTFADRNPDFGKFLFEAPEEEKINIAFNKKRLDTWVRNLRTRQSETTRGICDDIVRMQKHAMQNKDDAHLKIFSVFHDTPVGKIDSTMGMSEVKTSINREAVEKILNNTKKLVTISADRQSAVITAPQEGSDSNTVVQLTVDTDKCEFTLTAPNGEQETRPISPKGDSQPVDPIEEISLPILEDELEITWLSGSDDPMRDVLTREDEDDFDLGEPPTLTIEDNAKPVTIEQAIENRNAYEEVYSESSRRQTASDITDSKEIRKILALIKEKRSDENFIKDLQSTLTPQIIHDIKRGSDPARIQIPLSNMMSDYEFDLQPIKRIMKNILDKENPEELGAIIKLSMMGMNKEIYQNQFDRQLGTTVEAAFEQIVYGNNQFKVSESLLREGFFTFVKNVGSDLGNALKSLWQGKDAVEKVKMATAIGGLGGTLIGAAPVAAGLYAVSAAAGLSRRFYKEIPEERQARKDWFPEGQTILQDLFKEKQVDQFIIAIVKTNIINTVIKVINPDYKFRSKVRDPKKLKPVVQEFISQKEAYGNLSGDEKELFKLFSKHVHDRINKAPWAEYGGNVDNEFAIVSQMHINRLLNKVFLTDGGVERLKMATSPDPKVRNNRNLHEAINEALKELNIEKIYASRLRQVTKKRSSLVKGNVGNWFKDRLKPQWKTTVYAKFSSDIVRQVIGIEQSFMPKKSDKSLKDRAVDYYKKMSKERPSRSDESYLGYSLSDLIFENSIFENTNMFLNEDDETNRTAASATGRSRSDIDDQSVRNTESTLEDLLTGISPSMAFLTSNLERENLYQSLVVTDYLPYKDTEITSQMVTELVYTDTAAEAVKLQQSMPKADILNKWYELEPNSAGEGQQLISYWYSTKQYAGTANQLRLAIRNTATGEINFLGNAGKAIEQGWDRELLEQGLKIDGTNGIVETSNFKGELIDLNDKTLVADFMRDLKTGLIGSVTDEILKATESMTVEEFVQKTQDAFAGSEGGLHLVVPNDTSPDMLEKIALATAKDSKFLIMKIGQGIKDGKLTGEIPPDLLSGIRKGMTEFGLSEKILSKAGIDQETLNALKAFHQANQESVKEIIDLIQLKLKPMSGPLDYEKMVLANFKEHIGSLSIDKQEKIVEVIVKVKGKAANVGLDLAAQEVTYEEFAEKEVTKYKAIDREYKVPLNKNSAFDNFLEKFYNFSSILRTANMITSISTFLWKRGIDHALFQRHFMENIRLGDAINSDIHSVVAGGNFRFTNVDGATIGTTENYVNPAISDVAGTAEDVVIASGIVENYVYKHSLSSYLFENKIVTKKAKRSTVRSNKILDQITEHRKLQDMFKNMF